nr:DUF3297 family protein [Sphingomonas bacterium]
MPATPETDIPETDTPTTEIPATAPPGAADSPPDHVATNPRSPFYAPELLARGIGIRFNGQEKTNVDEYCVSEGWVKLAVGKSLDRKGNAMTIKLSGTVEPYFKDV